MNMVAVSVLIPVYNSEKYLKECLDSVVRQTLDDIEVIIIDDGSSDGSSDILDEYARKYPFVRVYHQKNVGVVETRCRLLSLAVGEYIAWVDSDDFIKQDMLEKMYLEARKKNAELVLCNYEFYPDSIKTKQKWYKPYKGYVDWFFIERNTQQWNKLVKRELLERLNLEECMRAGGEGVYALPLIKASGIVSIDEPLYYYRVGHTSLSNNIENLDWYLKNIDKTKGQLQAARKVKIGREWKEYFEYRVIYSLIQAAIVSAYNGEKETYLAIIKQLKDIEWKKNKLTKSILLKNHGKLKEFFFLNVIPLGFEIAKVTTRLSLRKKQRNGNMSK